MSIAAFRRLAEKKSYNKSYKEEPTRRLIGGEGMQNGLAHTHVWQSRIGKDITAAEILPEVSRVPAPHQAPQSGAPVPGRGAGCENQWRFCPPRECKESS